MSYARGTAAWRADPLRVAAALTPTLIFTLVLATILRERGAIPDARFGGLPFYAGLTTLLPCFVLHAAFDVTPVPSGPQKGRAQGS